MIDLLDEIFEGLSGATGKTVSEIYLNTTMAESREEVNVVLQLLVTHRQVEYSQGNDGYRRYCRITSKLDRDAILEDVEATIRSNSESTVLITAGSSAFSAESEESYAPVPGPDVEGAQEDSMQRGADMLQQHLFRATSASTIQDVTLPINLAQVQTDGALRYIDSTGKIKSLEEKHEHIVDVFNRNTPQANMIVREMGEKIKISSEQIKLLSKLICFTRN